MTQLDLHLNRQRWGDPDEKPYYGTVRIRRHAAADDQIIETGQLGYRHAASFREWFWLLWQL